MNDPGLVREFLAEAHEGLDRLDRDLVALEQAPGDRERLASVFRTVHNIKGTCGFLGFTRLQGVSHAGETLLGRLRDGRLTLTPEITSALLALGDAVRAILARIAETGGEGDADYAGLIATLGRLQAGEGAPAAAPAAVPPEAPRAAPAAGTATIRVDVDRLDGLINLVGELVLIRNRILQDRATQQDPTLLATAQRLNHVTTELQQAVMRTRMQPLGKLWDQYPRLVRDLALECGKQVRLVIDGQETELDQTVLETIKDPLTHLLRNAIDHGIEPPDERQAAGKPAEGRLWLRAFHEGGTVHIEVADDGRGIDVGRVRQRAVERGLLTAEQAARAGETELLALIFTPGFSTAARVTHVSGRGVGMDVVKTNVAKIGGCVDVRSRPGAGTTVHVQIPLTLAIIPALIVTAGGDRYAIPQVHVHELVRLDGDEGRGLERVHDVPVCRLRGKLLPVVDLRRELDPGETDTAATAAAVQVVVLQADGRRFGLVVDRVTDTEEIVVKPLGYPLKAHPLFAGATIRGDGRVALILDVPGIARRARVVAEGAGRPPAGESARAAGGATVRTVLLGELGGGRRVAVGLSQVTRLEQFPRAAVERAGGRDVVQYRGAILPLVHLGRVLPGGDAADPGEGPLPVVVYAEAGRAVGLVMGRILDVVETPLEIRHPARAAGTLGVAVVAGRAADVLDVPALARAACPDLFAAPAGVGG